MDRFHKFGLMCLALTVFVSSRYVASQCRLSCASVKCGNWTCKNYHSPKS